MGCVSSKIITRSRSFQEELDLSLKRRTNGFPALEGLLKAKNDEDQIPALLYSGNTNVKNLKSQEHENIYNPQHEPTKPETINLWELINGLEDDVKEEDQEEKKKPTLHIKIHTVEEYDALVAAEHKVSDSTVEPETRNVDCVVWSARSSVSDDDCFNDTNTKIEDLPIEKGLRRKAMVKELKPLKLQSFEFSSIGSLREWLGAGGQVVSPGSYNTPKFGKFVSRGEGSGHRRVDSNVFDPELVAGLEEAMKELTEEEHIIRQMLEQIE